MKEAHTIIIDIGNSRVKYYYSENTFFDLKTLISAISKKESNFKIYIISTVSTLIPVTIEQIKLNFAEKNLSIEEIKIFDVLQQNFLTNIYPELGADRVAKTIGALKLNPGKDLILIDFGTATTMTIASSEKKFLGGFINLGFRTSLKALSENCEALDDYSKNLNFLTKASTKSPSEAIIHGTYTAHIGLIQEWIKQANLVLNDEALTICTGGDARFFTKYFDKYISDDLLLKAALTEDLIKA